MYKFKSRYRCNRGNRLNRLNERISPTFWHCIPVSSADTRRHLHSANRHLLAVPRFRLNTQATAVGRSRLLARWPGTHFRILFGIHRAAQTVLGVYLKRTCSCVTSASSALWVLNDYALYKSTRSLTHSLAVLAVSKLRRFSSGTTGQESLRERNNPEQASQATS